MASKSTALRKQQSSDAAEVMCGGFPQILTVALLPRFTVLTEGKRLELKNFFLRWATSAIRVLAPGGHVVIATNPHLSHLVYVALIEAGFEKRVEIIRLVQTLRGGDRPKNAHQEFDEVTVMPRSCFEPWGLFLQWTRTGQSAIKKARKGPHVSLPAPTCLTVVSDRRDFPDYGGDSPRRSAAIAGRTRHG